MMIIELNVPTEHSTNLDFTIRTRRQILWICWLTWTHFWRDLDLCQFLCLVNEPICFWEFSCRNRKRFNTCHQTIRASFEDIAPVPEDLQTEEFVYIYNVFGEHHQLGDNR